MANKKVKTEEEILKLLNSRLKISKKFTEKKYIEKVKSAIKDYKIESLDCFSDESDIHNKLQIPYIFSTIESGLPSIFETMPNIIMTQFGREDREFTEFTNQVWVYVRNKINLEEEIENTGIMFLIGGMGSMKYGWETDTESITETIQQPMLNSDGTPAVDEMGQPVLQDIEKPREVVTKDQPFIEYTSFEKIYFSPESSFVLDDINNKIPFFFIEDTLTKDQIKYKYKINKKDLGSEVLKVSDVYENGTDSVADTEDELIKDKDLLGSDLERVKVFYFYGVLPKMFAPDSTSWKPDRVYSCIFTKDKLLEGFKVIEKKPILNLGNYGVPTEFFKFGESKILKDLEKDVSLGRSVMMDYRDRLATKLGIPNGTEYDEEAFKSPKVFASVKFIGDKLPQYITPPPVPEVVMTALEQSRSDIQMTSGQLDISRGGDSNTVNTATGQKIFSATHEKRINRKRKKIAKFIEAIAKNILKLCAENWEIDKFSQISGYSPEDITTYNFIEKLKNVGEEYDVLIEVEDISNNKEADKAQTIAMYRELKDSPFIKQDELIKLVIKKGFDQRDVERFLKGEMTPEQLIVAVEQLVNMGFISPEVGQQMILMFQQQIQMEQSGENQGGRPSTANPVDVVKNSMTGSDSTQIVAQNNSAKQINRPKM